MRFGLAVSTLLLTIGMMTFWLGVLYLEQGISIFEVFDIVWCGDSTIAVNYIVAILARGSFFLILISTMCANLVVCCLALIMERIIFKELRRSELEFSIQTSLDFVVSRSLAIYGGAKINGGPPTYMWLGWGILCGWANALHAMAHARLQKAICMKNDSEARKVLAMISIVWVTCLVLLVVSDFDAIIGSIGDGNAKSVWFFLWAYDVILLTLKTAMSFGSYFIDIFSEGTKKTTRTVALEALLDIATCILTIYLCTTVFVANGFAVGLFDLLVFVRGRNNVNRLSKLVLSFLSQMTAQSSFPFAYKKVAVDSDDDSVCYICHDTYEDNTAYSLTSCSHKFHAECVDQWFQKKLTCPICRKPINCELQHSVHANKMLLSPFTSILEERHEDEGTVF
eukprot:m.31686 g.31686  ORF g.31686 m.31686 type:complete len:396 (+) comp6324_c2_seq1:182-1369(+)